MLREPFVERFENVSRSSRRHRVHHRIVALVAILLTIIETIGGTERSQCTEGSLTRQTDARRAKSADEKFACVGFYQLVLQPFQFLKMPKSGGQLAALLLALEEPDS